MVGLMFMVVVVRFQPIHEEENEPTPHSHYSRHGALDIHYHQDIPSDTFSTHACLPSPQLLTRELAEDGYAGVEVRVVPLRTEIIIRATKTQNVLGPNGQRIRELTSVIQKR